MSTNKYNLLGHKVVKLYNIPSMEMWILFFSSFSIFITFLFLLRYSTKLEMRLSEDVSSVRVRCAMYLLLCNNTTHIHTHNVGKSFTAIYQHNSIFRMMCGIRVAFLCYRRRRRHREQRIWQKTKRTWMVLYMVDARGTRCESNSGMYCTHQHLSA